VSLSPGVCAGLTAREMPSSAISAIFVACDFVSCTLVATTAFGAAAQRPPGRLGGTR
jgi:hypothetical protein